jgi:hypothetical protein
LRIDISEGPRQLHRDVVRAADPAELERARDVRMDELRRQLGLANESVDEHLIVGELRQRRLGATSRFTPSMSMAAW